MNTDPKVLLSHVSVEASVLTWMTVHGNLCLALRHPSNQGESRRVALAMIDQISTLLVEAGAMTRQEMEYANHVEERERHRRQS